MAGTDAGPVTIHFDINNAHAYRIDGTVGATGKGILIGMLSAFGSAAIVALVFIIIYFFRYTHSGRILLDRLGRPGEFDDEQAFAREEAQALEDMDDFRRTEYLRAKAFVQANPPESVQTDISLSQFLAIQEKGVSAWEFEPELEIANCFVEGRTEIEFFDAECSVQSNLPIPKQNEVYYWEAKIYEKPESSLISIGLSTKPYPLFRLPGLHKCSLAYTSSGERRYNQPFQGTPYGPAFVQGDVVGVGYRPRSGTVFFTRNGRKLDDVAHGLKTQNFFPSVGANGPCHVHVNFGQLGFVFIEANVKKWGLAPMAGSLAPPPPYGSEQGSILLEGGRDRDLGGATSSYVPTFFNPGHGRSISAQVRLNTTQQPLSPGPRRSPTDISLAALSPTEAGEGIQAFVGEEANVPNASHASLASVLSFIDNHTPLNRQGHHHHHYQPSIDANRSSEQAAATAAAPRRHNQNENTISNAVNEQQQESNSRQQESQQEQQHHHHHHHHHHHLEHQQVPANNGSDEPPPPDYESPQHTPAAANHENVEAEESRPLLPLNQQEEQREPQGPPIPSYDAAVSGAESRPR